jgi:hypothetical protein
MAGKIKKISPRTQTPDRIEAKLFATADKLHGAMDASDCKPTVRPHLPEVRLGPGAVARW